MKKIVFNWRQKMLSFFGQFENVVTAILCIIIAMIIIVSLIRIIVKFYHLFALDISQPEEITFEDYQDVFGKIMTLLISLEFMSSILKVLNSHEIKTLILDVVLITALAIARKLIVFDYDHHEPAATITMGGLLVSIGIFYFLIRFHTFGKNN